MTNYGSDDRVVLTLDAGGTNFIFSAIQGNKEIVQPEHFESQPNDLEKCLSTIKTGFESVMEKISVRPSAISFAFPGPADYLQGIIGDLPNLPAFRGGVPLAPILMEHFKIPVFIENDGNLFAYGEAMSGFLPHINSRLKEAGVPKVYSHLIGVTLGTGFGGGIVINGDLYSGDNSNSGEVWIMRNKLFPNSNTEETIGVASIIRRYQELSNDSTQVTPKDIFDIASGTKAGNKTAAKTVFNELGEVLGDALATLVNLLDACVVIGGGIAAAHPLFMDSLLEQMNESGFENSANSSPRMAVKAYNSENSEDMAGFTHLESQAIQVGSNYYHYDPQPKIAIGISKLGTSRAIALGAYAHALRNLDK